MNYFFLIGGILILLLVYYEISYTILTLTGAGKLTGRFTWLIWHLFLYVSRKDGSKKVFNYSGIATIYSILFLWIALIWVGNSLIISADPDSVVNIATRDSATLWQKVYFTGYTLSTLGNGDFMATTDFWRVYTVTISFTGLIIITLSITYMVPVLSEVIRKRQLSILIAAMGETPHQILLNNWNGKDFNSLNSHFHSIASSLTAHAQNHLAYPILHYFHSSHKKESSAIMITVLDEAITLLLLHVKEDIRPAKQSIITVRKAITGYLETLPLVYICPDKSAPGPLNTTRLEEASIPIIQMENVEELYVSLKKRRSLLVSLLRNDGWKWEDIYDNKYKTDLDIHFDNA